MFRKLINNNTKIKILIPIMSSIYAFSIYKFYNDREVFKIDNADFQYFFRDDVIADYISINNSLFDANSNNGNKS